MSPVTGGGVWDGGRDPSLRPANWVCPTCKAANTGPLEAGCVSCGAGTPQQAEASVAARQALQMTDEQLRGYLIDQGDLHTAMLQLVLSRRARLTVARALAAYAETGTPHVTEEIPKAAVLTWARKIASTMDEEDRQ